ncbi:MAG: Ig-like domain-containing protein [Woeseiaceae bacterium]|nr:Ig-like domain-containing protein [Woeseiaceae bacterium]
MRMSPSARLLRRLTGLASALATSLVLHPAAALANNDQYRIDIDALKTSHRIALPAGIITPPPFDKPAELAEYELNIGLKFVPTVIDAPPPVVVQPNVPDPATGDLCSFRYPRAEHGLDPVFDFEDIFGFTLGLPNNWGRLDDGDTFLSNASPPAFYHYSTGAYITVRRAVYEVVDDPEPWYPAQQRRSNVGKRILFTNTNSRSSVVNNDYLASQYEEFPVGITPLSWEAENKLDILFDVLFQPLIFVAEMKYSAKAAAKAAKTKRFARNWGGPAAAWARSIDRRLFRAIAADTARFLGTLGLEISANQIENASGQALTNWPTGAINRVSQRFAVLDTIPPTVEITRQPEPFEANTLGGERADRHFDELRELLSVSDNCNRPVQIDSQPRGTRFWPVRQTTTLQWCGRDMGPTSGVGGFNESCAEIRVEVVDTRPPILFPPPAVNLISSDPSNAIDIGWAGVFDVADPEVSVTNDAPDTYPLGRTPVTWTATDGSGNTATATQWVNVKSENVAPQAMPLANVPVVSFDETRIDLEAFELEDTLDGRYDQLTFRIQDTPDHGFFVAPLFPFFIDDHRQHRINPDGTYSSYYTEAQQLCADTGDDPDQTRIVDPVYVAVTDEGVMYVMDRYLTCQTVGTPFTNARSRLARFEPDENGELVFASQFDIGQNQPGDLDRHLFIDHKDQLWVIPADGTRIEVVSAELDPVMTIDFDELTMINPVTGRVEEAFPDSNRRLQSVAVSDQDVLYATDGREVHAYDLMRRQPDNAGHYLRLPSVVYNPDQSVVDVTTEEPWASYHRFMQNGYADMVLDSDGNLYISDNNVNRIWKFAGLRLSDDRNDVEQLPEFVGWLGKCGANLDPSVLACDTTLERSIGFSCQDDLCGTPTGVSGDGHGQFSLVTGLAMSPQDVLYATDTQNYRVQRFTTDGFFAGEAVSECNGGCFVLGDFGFVTNVAVNSNNFYLLDTDNDLTHVFETTPVTDIDDQTMSASQTAFVKYKSNNNYTGPDSFSFVAYDGLEFSSEAQVGIDVSRNFRSPIATPGLKFTGDEDTDIPMALSGLDPDDDTLDFEIDTGPAHGTVTRDGDAFVYTPDPHFFGADTFTFVATDAPTSVPALTSAPETVTVHVLPVNDAPAITADALDPAPLVYEMQLQALLEDVDLDDRHRIAIDWGDGEIAASDSDEITLGRAPGKVRILADHAYQQISDPGNPNDIVITICASDAPSADPLTCASPDVNATLALPVVVEEMVDLRIAIDDSLPKNSDPDIPEIQIPDPLLDGGAPVTYTLEVLNKVPGGSDYRPTATNTALTIRVPEDMTLVSVTPQPGTCGADGPTISCTFGDLAADASVFVDVTAAGAGTILADTTATLQAEATALEKNVGDENAGSWQTTLVVNGDLDPDADGVPNREDPFPGDPGEWADTDGDGTGNNADPDDDNDTLPDRWEDRYGLDSLDASDRTGDPDGDGLTNEMEWMSGMRPNREDSDRDGLADGADNCPLALNVNQFDVDGDGQGDLCDPGSRAAAARIGDADGDGITDVALLESAGGTSTVYSKSGDTDVDIAVFDILAPPDHAEALVGIANAGSTGRRGVAMVYTDDTGGWHVKVRDAWSGTIMSDEPVFDSSHTVVDTGTNTIDAGDELLILARGGDGKVRVHRQNPAGGTSPGEIEFFAQLVEPQPLAVLGIGEDVALVIVDDGTGTLHAESRNTSDGGLVRAWTLPPTEWLSVRAAAIGDGFVVLTTNADDTSQVSTWSVADDLPLATFDVLNSGITAFAMTVSADAVPTIVIGNSDTSGAIEVWTYDAATGAELNRVGFLDTDAAPRGVVLGRGSTGAEWRIGVLASTAGGDVSLELRNPASGAELATLTAASMSPPPPPPPPPSGGNAGGGGSAGWLLLLALIGSLARRARRARRAGPWRSGGGPSGQPPAILGSNPTSAPSGIGWSRSSR